MMRPLATVCTLISVLFFPWQMTAVLALGAASVEPLVPLAAGLLIDTLYYVPSGGALPLFTLGGAVVSSVALFVQSRLRPRSM